MAGKTNTPFLSAGLACMANPSIERFQQAAEELKTKIEVAHQDPDEVVRQFKEAYERIVEQRRSVFI